MHEDDHRICLQIELPDDYAVTITLRKDRLDAPMGVDLWHGNGEHDLADDYGGRVENDWRRLRNWAAKATGGVAEEWD